MIPERRRGVFSATQRRLYVARKRAVRGFTLLEVLVALAVLAAALGALIAGIGQSADNAVRLRDKTFAQWVAMNKIVEARLEPGLPRVGTRKGNTLLANREWHWTLKVSNTPDRDLRRLEVEVRSGGADQPVVTTVVGFQGRV